MPDYAVTTAFTATDKVSRTYKHMAKAARIFEDRSVRAFRQASKEANIYWTITKGIVAASVIRATFSGIQESLRSLVETYRDFDDAAVAATVRFKDIGANAIAVSENLDRIKMAAREAGATTVFTAVQAAEALDFFARAGFKSEVAIGILNSAISLAVASNTEFAQAADWSTDLLGAFGLNVADTAQKIKNYKHLNDVLVATVNTANVNLEQMFETMKVGAPVAIQMGASLEDVAAMTAIMAGAGIKAERGGTTIRNMFTRLSAPTTEVWEGIRKLGLEFEDVADKAGRMRPPHVIIQKIAESLEGVSQFERVGVLKNIFGAWALAGGANLVKAVEGLKDYREMLDEVALTNIKTADIMGQSLGRRFLLLKSAAIEAGIKFMEAFRPEIVGAVDELTDALQKVDFKSIIKGIRFFVDPLVALTRFIRFNATAFKEGAIVLGIYFGVLNAQRVWEMVKAFKALTAIQALYNAVVLKNKYVVIITAIIGGIYLLIKYWDQAVVGIQHGLDYILDAFKISYEMIRRMFFDPLILWIAKLGRAIQSTLGFDITKLSRVIEDIRARQQTPFVLETRWGETARRREARSIRESMTAVSTGNRSVLDVNFRNAPPGMTAVPGADNALEINVESMGVFP